MLRVFKYDLPNKSERFFIELPHGAKILSAQAQRNKPTMWVLLNPNQSLKKRHFYLSNTGSRITEDESDMEFIATIQMDGGELVQHLFELS